MWAGAVCTRGTVVIWITSCLYSSRQSWWCKWSNNSYRYLWNCAVDDRSLWWLLSWQNPHNIRERAVRWNFCSYGWFLRAFYIKTFLFAVVCATRHSTRHTPWCCGWHYNCFKKWNIELFYWHLEIFILQ